MNENKHRDEEVEIDLREVFFVLLKKWWMIAIGAIVGAALAFGLSKFFMTKTYTSSAKLFVLNKTTSVTSLADIQIGSALSNDFMIITKSNPVIDSAIEIIKEETGKVYTRGQIKGALSVTNANNTRIITITVTHTDPEMASIIANAVSACAANRMGSVMGGDPPTNVEDAEPANYPSGPHTKRNTVIGFLLGCILVSGVIIVHHMMNDNIKTEEDVERYLGVPTLAIVPLIKGRDSKREELKEMSEALNERRERKRQS
ncbi:MAG: polysaccharide export protein [Lachnospiraceae bacterium]|nr:polysaccharide export protein [Lachnospiraceae bacterium]